MEADLDVVIPSLGAGPVKRLAVSPDRFLVAGGDQVVAINRRNLQGHQVFSPSVPQASMLRRSIRTIIPTEADECWLASYYGILSRWSLRSPQDAPLEVLRVAHGVQSAYWVGSQIVASRALTNGLFSVHRPNGVSETNTHLAAGACCDGHRIALTEEIRIEGEPPVDRVHADLAHYVNRTAMAATSGRGFVLAFLLEARLNIYDPEGRLHVSVAGPEHHRMEFSVARFDDTGAAAFRPSPEASFAYIDVATNQDLIVGLYANRPFGVHGPEGVFSANTIHVFDWAGRFHGRFKVAKDLTHVALDPASNRLYGATTPSSGGQLVVTDLDRLL